MSAYTTQSIPVDDVFAGAPAQWLTGQAQKYDLHYLLAHADDGVIWGRFDADGLHTSHGIAPQSPPLREVTLQQCRLFGLMGEMLVWRDSSGWRARLITDGADANEWYDEDQVLWGTTVDPRQDGFSLVSEGAQGMRHAVPTAVTEKDLADRQLRLRVRHYITYNEDGEATVIVSRLVQLLPEAA
jgi:CRISPR-associated protein (TIGR03984 family)